MTPRPTPATVLYVSADGEGSPAIESLRAVAGLEVEIAGTAAGALETIETEDVDCLVSENTLPGTDGPELLGTVRERGFEFPAVLYAQDGSHERLAQRVTAALDADATQVPTTNADGLRRQDRKLIDALSETFPDSVYVYGEHGEYLDVILGRRRDPINTREELLGTTVDDVFDAQTADRLRETISTVLETGEIREIEYALEGDAGTRWFEGALAPVAGGYRGEPAVLLSARDITDRRTRERRLERKNEFLDEFASVISHDIATPLGVIKNKARLVEITGDPSHASDIHDAAERVQALVDELRELATQGKRVGDTTPVELERVTREAWGSVGTPGATLTVESSAAIQADRGRLRQFLENLLANAVEHGASGGEAVTVTVGTLPDGFYLADDGPGIPQSEREQVFEQGYTTTDDGTGMGLAIVRRIADGHGWNIGVSASNSGNNGSSGGARFEITGVEFARR